MRRKNLVMTMILPMLLLQNGCGGGGSDGGGGAPPIPPPPVSTFSVTLTSIELDRSADQRDMPVTGVPADGATLTVE